MSCVSDISLSINCIVSEQVRNGNGISKSPIFDREGQCDIYNSPAFFGRLAATYIENALIDLE